MKNLLFTVLGIFLTSSVGWPSHHSVHCALATSTPRKFHEMRLLGPFAQALKNAAQKRHPEYPWDFELVWLDNVGYLWQEKVTKAYLMIKGDQVSINAPLDDATPNQWTDILFPQSLRRFWFASLQSREVLKANREILARWFTHSVYPVLLSHDFERAAEALKTRELSPQEFNHLIRRMAAVQKVVEIPPYVLTKHDNKLVRVRAGLASDLDGNAEQFVIHTHARMEGVHASEVLLRDLFGEEFKSSLGQLSIGHWSHHVGPAFTADTYSLKHYRAIEPEDEMSDLLYGLEQEGDLLLDFYPTLGHFSLTDDSSHAAERRSAWKKYLEALIGDHGLMPFLQ